MRGSSNSIKYFKQKLNEIHGHAVPLLTILRAHPRGFEYRTGTHRDAKLVLVAFNAIIAAFILACVIFAPLGEKPAALALIIPVIAFYCMITWPMHNYHVTVDVETRLVTVEGKKSLQVYFDDIVAVERHKHNVALSVKGGTREMEICTDVGSEDLSMCAMKIDRLLSISLDERRRPQRAAAATGAKAREAARGRCKYCLAELPEEKTAKCPACGAELPSA